MYFSTTVHLQNGGCLLLGLKFHRWVVGTQLNASLEYWVLQKNAHASFTHLRHVPLNVDNGGQDTCGRLQNILMNMITC